MWPARTAMPGVNDAPRFAPLPHPFDQDGVVDRARVREVGDLDVDGCG